MPAHTALTVKKFLVEYNRPMSSHLPYSPGRSPCDIYLFLKVKIQAVYSVKEKTTCGMKELLEGIFQHYFKQWKFCIDCCREKGGVCVEVFNN